MKVGYRAHHQPESVETSEYEIDADLQNEARDGRKALRHI